MPFQNIQHFEDRSSTARVILILVSRAQKNDFFENIFSKMYWKFLRKNRFLGKSDIFISAMESTLKRRDASSLCQHMRSEYLPVEGIPPHYRVEHVQGFRMVPLAWADSRCNHLYLWVM